MRTTLLIPFVLVIFCSCSSYRYFTVASDDTAKNEKNELVVETDILRVTYNFHGKKGPFRITIYNKSDQAWQVDWNRSALIINETSTTYYKPDLWINGDLDKTNSTVTRTFNGKITGEQGTEFLPPRSFVSKTVTWLGDNNVLKVSPNNQPARSGKTNTLPSGGQTRFTKENSPLVFRSYLTVAKPGNSEVSFTVDNQFYISGQSARKGGFDMEWLRSDKKGNEFCTETVSGRTGGIVAMGAAVAMIFVLYKDTH